MSMSKPARANGFVGFYLYKFQACTVMLITGQAGSQRGDDIAIGILSY